LPGQSGRKGGGDLGSLLLREEPSLPPRAVWLSWRERYIDEVAQLVAKAENAWGKRHTTLVLLLNVKGDFALAGAPPFPCSALIASVGSSK
jgi:hypothetical protein